VQRITISLDDDLADRFDARVRDKGYENRSEAVRDLLRRTLEESDVASGASRYCVAVVSYVYNHHERELASRLADLHHDHHDLSLSTMHVHLDHEQCVETVIVRGPTRQAVAFAESVIAQSGVRHGKINVISVDLERTPAHHGHIHYHPKR
jgi:CopG family transcriptional regulator, nickel-responsive regulator